jgi:uncharacterized protein (TIGR04255 family)
MTNPLGAWGKAPLAYVLAQVRTEQIADIKEYQPSLAGKLRPHYPLQRKQQGARLIATQSKLVVEPQQQETWEFASSDNRMGIILRESGVVLHATTYIDSNDFLSKLNDVIKIFSETVPSVFVNRVGLRYIDFVIPQPKEDPERYVNPKLNCDLGFSKRGGYFSTSVSIYPMKEGQVVLRYVRGPGQPQLPPELAMFSLEPSPLMQQIAPDDHRQTAIIDTDRNREFSPVEQLDPAKIHAIFKEMHSDVSRMFKEFVITEHAKKIWEAK